MPTPIRLGCTGWAYDDWRGGFYPQGCDASEYLERYAQVFSFTEVDSSFYGTPQQAVTRRWNEVTPAGFVFSLKVPGEITHEKRLRAVEEPLAGFLQALTPLAEAGKLGPLVLQLPPSFTLEHDRRALEGFLDGWPRGMRLAVELRDASWWRPETYRMLRDHGAALVWNVTMYGQAPPVATTDWLYARFVGDRELQRFDQVQRDHAPIIREWAPHVLGQEAAREAYVVVNNHFMGFAPQTARVAADIFGLTPPQLERARRRRHQRPLGEF